MSTNKVKVPSVLLKPKKRVGGKGLGSSYFFIYFFTFLADMQMHSALSIHSTQRGKCLMRVLPLVKVKNKHVCE